MGLAASQGRLLLLTAKKSDLEFRAQSISQSRLLLAQQQEGISRRYAEKTSNRCLKFKPFPNNENGNGETPEAIDLTFRNLWNSTVDLGDGRQQRAYKITLAGDPNRPVISHVNDLIETGNYNMNDKDDGKPYVVSNDGNKVVTSDGCTWTIDKNLDASTHYGGAGTMDKGGADSYLKYMLETGMYSLSKYNQDKVNEDGSKGGWQTTTIAGESGFSDEYYEADDAEAKAEYDQEMLKVKIKDQRLELDLKQVETQHKAVETEIESVQKVIQKNVETSFKIFS